MKHLNRLPLLGVLLAVPLLMAPAVQIPEKLTDGSFADSVCRNGSFGTRVSTLWELALARCILKPRDL